MWLLFIAGVLSLALAAYLDWKQRSPLLMLWPLNFLFFYLPLIVYWSYEEYHDYVMIEALSYSIFCNLAYFLTAFLLTCVFKNSYLTVCGVNFESSKFKDYLILGAALSIPLIFLLNGVGVSQILSSTLSDKRELSSWYLISILISSFLFPQIIYAIKNKKKFLIFLIVFVFLLVSLYFRSRSILVLMCLPAGYYIVRFTNFGIVKVLLLGGGAFLLSSVLKVIRYQGELKEGLNVSNWGGAFMDVIKSLFASGDFSIVKVFLQMIPDCKTSSWCGTYSFVSKFFSNFGLSPETRTIEYTLYDNYVESGVGGSLHPTGYGFSYGDAGGYLGVLFFVGLAIFRIFINRFLMNSERNYAYLGYVMYFTLFFSRGSVYNSFMLLGVALFMEALISTAKRMNQRV